MQTCSGAHTTTGKPPPYAYTTRPSLPVAGALRLSVHSRLSTTASKPVAFSATSRFASKARGTSGERGAGAPPTGSAGTVGECFAAPLPCASPNSRTRTASASGYLSGEGTGSFFNTNGGGCAGVAYGAGGLFVVRCAFTTVIPTTESASIVITHFVFMMSLTEPSTT